MKIVLSLVSFSVALVLSVPSCTDSNETEWCFDEHLLFPIGTEWTYNFYSNEFGDLGTITYKATKCLTIDNQKWILTEQTGPSDWIWEFDKWEYSLVDSVFYRRYVQNPRGRPEKYFLNDAINHPDTLEWDKRFRVTTEKLAFFDSLHVKETFYYDVYYLKFEEQYNPSDSLWSNYYCERYYLWFAPRIGVIKYWHELYEGIVDNYAYIDSKELIHYKYKRGER
jgi:hypothetical protein